MNYLVLGASGMAGHTISIYLKEKGHSVTGFSRKGVSFLEKQFFGDARDTKYLANIINRNEFDVIINCIGVLNQYADRDPKSAVYLNGELPHILARIVAEKERTRIFHMSTDCVFAGNTGPYTEHSIPDGQTVYDWTKASGELKDNRNLTFRCSIIGPDTRSSGIGLFNWFMAQAELVKGYTHAIWTGLTTLELAKAMERAAEEDVAGLVNMVPPVSISKYDLLGLFNKNMRDGLVTIVPDDRVRLDKTLVRTNYDSSFRPKGYVEQIAEMSDWIHEHRSLYPHYFSESNLIRAR